VIISLIVAMDEQRGIGFQGKLPWRLPDDLRRFKAITIGHHLVMGRVTFESIGRPLPGRTTIVMTRDPGYHPEGCLVAPSLADALDTALQRGEEEVFVIGGGEVFSEALPIADRIYLTQVNAVVEADTFFPEFDPGDWVEVESEEHAADEDHPMAFTFKVLERRAQGRGDSGKTNRNEW
jgi:dihydrofolate reductase